MCVWGGGGGGGGGGEGARGARVGRGKKKTTDSLYPCALISKSQLIENQNIKNKAHISITVRLAYFHFLCELLV